MMNIRGKSLIWFLDLLIVIVMVFLLKDPIQAQTPVTSSGEVLYRGNSQRAGNYNVQGVPQLTGIDWKSSVGEAGFSSPVYADGTVYIGTNRGELLAFDGKTGAERWSFKSVGGNASSVAVANGVVYIGLGTAESNGMGLYALDTQTGKQLWDFKTDSPIWLSAPLLHNGAVYFGDQNGVFYSVDLKTHQERWRVNTNRAVLWYAAAENDAIFFSASDTMVAIDSETGQQKWQLNIHNDWMPHAVVNGVLYAGDRNHRLYALDVRTGKEIWTFNDRVTDRGEWSAPAVADGVVYAGNRTWFMYAFDAQTGKQLWKFQADAPATSDPVVANGILYFGVAAHGNTAAGQTKGYFYAVDVKTGQERWKFEAEGEIFNGPALSEDRVYCVTAAAHLYALH
jgi:outer membrane protein assembly factor BamB